MQAVEAPNFRFYFNSTPLTFTEKSVKAEIWGTYMTKNPVINHNQTCHE